ncbi:DedA family protein [Cellulosimicrobium cellulans]|uniref:DedA family protein n=1 Tax=Cellulosimicrobium cellulans TaxID=1710 RepID=A0A4Y4DUH2_CELCE|nr:DedA family protein [Cellulosimicrobium cellulans]
MPSGLSAALSAALPAASTAEPALDGVAGWAVNLMETLGPVGAAIAIALENLFPPLPSEIILPLAGFTASQGSFGLVEAILWTTAGSIVGALALYLVGALVGRERTRWVAERLPLVKVADVDRTEQFFLKHGGATVFFGRFIPIFRSLISIPAGVERMPLWKFTALTAAGSAVWNTIFVYAGYALGEQWHVVEEYAGVLQKVVIAVVAAAVVWFVVTRVWRWVHDDERPAHARGGRSSSPARDDA